MNKKVLVCLAFFVVVWAAILFLGLTDQQGEFEAWVKQNGTDDWYNFPLIKYVGVAGYSAFGDLFFLAFPFLTMLLSFCFLMLLCKEFNFNLWVFLIVWLTVAHAIRYFGFFSHDALPFLAGSAFAFYFFRTIYKNTKEQWILFVIGFVSLFFRESGFVFLFLAFCSLFSNKKTRGNIAKKQQEQYYDKLFSFGFFPFLYKSAFDMVYSLQQAWQGLKTFNPYAVYKYFTNPVFSISFLTILLRPDKWGVLILAVTFAYCYVVAVNPLYYNSMFRYTFSLVPLHLFYVLRWLK